MLLNSIFPAVFIALSLFTRSTISTPVSPATRQLNPPTPPTLHHVFSGDVNLTPSIISIPGPFGVRVSGGFTGGSLTDYQHNAFATVVADQGAENGIVDGNSNLHIDARITIQFADNKYAYMQFQGVGILSQENHFFVKIEADTSSTYASLNGMFLIGHSIIANGVLSFDIFSPTQPTW
ncbi:hypothetical protein FRC03_011591 [Tulasnella sp. 419]|nr:hypothetical protein FRC03_011591 [Tulasnella sp. 419]